MGPAPKVQSPNLVGNLQLGEGVQFLQEHLPLHPPSSLAPDLSPPPPWPWSPESGSLFTYDSHCPIPRPTVPGDLHPHPASPNQ